MFKVAITMNGFESKSTWHLISIKDEILRLQCKIEAKRKRSSNPIEDLLATQHTDSVASSLLDTEKNMMENVNALSNAEIKHTDSKTLMVCYDSGGQPEFFDIMPLLATNPTGYIMVLDMSKKLDEQTQSIINIDGEEYPLKVTYKSVDLMKNAIASIQSSGNDSLHQCLLVVGTHLDQCNDQEENILNLDEQVHRDLINVNAESLIKWRQKKTNRARKIDRTHIIHPIALFLESKATALETKERDDVAQEIRTAVEKMSKSKNIQQNIPINLLLLQLEIQLTFTKSSFKYIAQESCYEYAEKCYIKEEDIPTVLKYFHSLGIILYYDNLVFSPQWLFDRISEIIFEKYTSENYSIIGDIEKGMLKKEYLVTLYQGKIKHPLTVDRLIKIFVNQNIMAQLSEDNLFMPSLLNPCPQELESISLSRKYGCKSHETLHVKFENQYFPRAVFCFLATQFIAKKWLLQEDLRYNDILVFQIPEGSGQFLCLVDYKTDLAIELYQKNHEHSHIAPHEICKVLHESLIAFSTKIQADWKFKFGFTCKSDGCKFFAGVQLQYPFLLKKCCSKCNMLSNLKFDEAVWMTSPKDSFNILRQVCV